ncbi:EpsG family protein [Sphingobacterium multivorum]|uniref:EpsG family protein n=1 Tax=Sphingobacterium multivorum TaxID=28454 RepID=UPI0019189FF9|nr:EpsG family protein [Sphingobacterium multivorum]QQT63620.1 EpsG family protein [Sphingobacterium multivorum]
MMIYAIYWFLLSFFSNLEINILGKKRYESLHKCIGVFCILLMVFLVGFRWKVGTDWFPYYSFFIRTPIRTFLEGDRYMDLGYTYFNDIFYHINSNYTFLLTIHAIIYYSCIYYGYKFFTPYKILSFFLFSVIFFGLTGANRQLLAISLGFVSLVSYLKGEYLKTSIFFILAVLLHSSAVFLLLYPFFDRRIKPTYVLIIFLLCSIIGQTNFIVSIFSVFGGYLGLENKVEAYSSSEEVANTSMSIIGILRRVLTVYLLLYNAKMLRSNFRYFDLCLNSYLLTVLAYALFAKVPILAGRGMLYFNIMEPILLIYLISLLKKYKLEKVGYVFIYVLIIFFFYQSINLFPKLFIPYHGILFDTNF